VREVIFQTCLKAS